MTAIDLPLLLTAVALIDVLLLLVGCLLLVARGWLAVPLACRLAIEGRPELTVSGGQQLAAALVAHGVRLPSACGGKGTCGSCRVRVIAGAEAPLPTEVAALAPTELLAGWRLACQVRVRGDLRLALSDETLSARSYQVELVASEPLSAQVRRLRFRWLPPVPATPVGPGPGGSDRQDGHARSGAAIAPPSTGGRPEPVGMPLLPGQYLQVSVDDDGETVERGYSVASPPTDRDGFTLEVKQVPDGLISPWLHALQPGARLVVTGPYGEFRLRTDTDGDVVCIAGGVGVAPMRSIIGWLHDTGSRRHVWLYWGGHRPVDLYDHDAWERLARQWKGFTYVPAVLEPTPGWSGEQGLISEVFARRHPAIDSSDADPGSRGRPEAYVCGPPPMVTAMLPILQRHGFAEHDILFDRF